MLDKKSDDGEIESRKGGIQEERGRKEEDREKTEKRGRQKGMRADDIITFTETEIYLYRFLRHRT